MSRKLCVALFATTALQIFAPTMASAQAEHEQGPSSVSNMDIVVTARREAENLQDVPVSVQVVSGEQIQKLSITNVTEIAKLAPGLTLGGSLANEVVIVRGVRWTPGSGTPATPIYLNELAFDPAAVMRALFDIGQVEVLRGPQGTARGAPSISGAITLTTRRPDLKEFGGYVQGLYGSGDHVNIQGAINVPIIPDVLAVRFAAFHEESDSDRVRSVNSSISPRLKNTTLRLSARFQPTDTLSFDVMYQRMRQMNRSFAQVVGTGSPGFAALGIPANFNGPALTVKDNKSVQDAPNHNPNNVDHLTLNASWDILGQRLNYNFGKQYTSVDAFDQNDTDVANLFPGYSPYQFNRRLTKPQFTIHEIRLSSIRAPGRFFDYDVGYYSKQSSGVIGVDGQAFLPGAFGAPFIAQPGDVTTPVARYTLPNSTFIGLKQDYESVYGNVQLHIGEGTEFSAGVRRIWDRVPTNLQTTLLTDAYVTFPRFLPPASGGCPSPLLPDSPVYGPAYCDVQAVTAGPLPAENYGGKNSATIYNVSLSHKLSDAVMVYGTVGSSFRTGLPSIGNSGLPGALVVAKPEKATSYELGVKTTPARGIRFNADIFQIDYKDQLTQFEGVQYLSNVTGQISSTSLSFFSNVDSRIRGFEVELAIQPIENFNLSANAAYSKIKSKGGLVPCNSATPLTAANPINFCQSAKGQTLNASAPFQATINGDYTVPLGALNGYFRFNVNYQGKNPNYGTSTVETKSYTLVDLFAGVNGGEGAWDIGLYAKNVFNKRALLRSQELVNNYPIFAAPIGYERVITTLPREVGVTARWSFGSR